MRHLTEKTAIITGASRGIGEATARYLAAEGAHVVLAARSAQAITRIASDITASGGKAIAIPCDVARYDEVEILAEKAKEIFGSIDILVNNAGLIDPIARIAESDPAEWGRIIDINTKGVYHGLRAVLPIMLGQGRGTVINISSGAATSALAGWSHYCSSKAAVLSLTRCAHTEYAEHGILVTGVSPGTVATDMQREIKASGLNPVSQLDWSDHIPPGWVAKTIAWLCGPDGADYAGTDFSLKTKGGR